MDTEEHLEIKQAERGGYPYTDEGPYYYHSFWEAYKGGIKGKLGGLGIGALTGAIAGVIAAAAIAYAFPVVGAAAIGWIIGGFAAGGMIYGAHEFSDVGHVSGAIAAGNEIAEKRMQAFENGKFAELKQELGEVKAMISGKPVADSRANAEAIEKAAGLDNYRTTHYIEDDGKELPAKNKYVFWKIAAIGLVVGLAAGALLAGGGFIAPLVESLGSAFATGALAKIAESTVGQYIISMTAMGAIGASFGINRDVFRKIFDKTDLWFKGILNKHQTSSPTHTVEASVEKTPSHPVSTVVYDGLDKSDTYHRDKVLAQAQQALLSLDHTNARLH